MLSGDDIRARSAPSPAVLLNTVSSLSSRQRIAPDTGHMPTVPVAATSPFPSVAPVTVSFATHGNAYAPSVVIGRKPPWAVA